MSKDEIILDSDEFDVEFVKFCKNSIEQHPVYKRCISEGLDHEAAMECAAGPYMNERIEAMKSASPHYVARRKT